MGRGRENFLLYKAGYRKQALQLPCPGPDTNTELGLELTMLPFSYQVTKFTKCKPLESFLKNLGANMYLKL